MINEISTAITHYGSLMIYWPTFLTRNNLIPFHLFTQKSSISSLPSTHRDLVTVDIAEMATLSG